MSLNPLTWPLAGKLATLAVVAALVAFLVVGHGRNSNGLTWTCTMDGYGNVTVVFTSHASRDMVVNFYDILFYDQSGNETGSDQFGGPVVPAGQEYIDHHSVFAFNRGGGTICKVAAVDSGP